MPFALVEGAKKLGVEFGPEHPVVVWAVRHSGFLITRFRVLEHGRSSYQIVRGKSYRGEMLQLGEQCC